MRRQSVFDPALGEFGVTVPASFPLVPCNGAQPPPDPWVEFPQHGRRLAEAEIRTPATKVLAQVLDDLLEAPSPCPSREFPDLLSEPIEGLASDPPFDPPSARGKAETQKLATMDPVHRALALVDPKLQAPFEKPDDTGHDALTSAMTADVDIAIIGKADVPVVACLQFPIEAVEHQVR